MIPSTHSIFARSFFGVGYHRLVLVWAVVACLLGSLRAQNITAVTVDPAPDKNYPAAMDSIIIPSHGSNMYGVIYLARGEAPHPTMVILHGLPGIEQNLDIAQAVRRAGWNVIAFHYRGSWASQGTFSFSNALEDVPAAVDFVTASAIVKKYRIDPSRVVLLAHSFGGFLAVQSGSRDSRIFGMVLLDPWNLGASIAQLKPADEKETIEDFADSVNVLSGCTAESLLAEAKSHAKEWDFSRSIETLSARPLLLIGADRGDSPDNQSFAYMILKTAGKRATVKSLPTDHFFSDHRIAVAETIVRWLEQFK
ncbi:MAG TPA: alpha/beta hydrolase [Opitutaceae bacterium]|nr:alpha/beta hydrolase [Opitutaceae bacterium]